MSCIHGEKGLICMRCEESFDREVLEPSSELVDVEEMAKYYAEECDNESGSFLSRDLIKIRVKSFKAGHASRQQEVDELKHSKLNLLDACSDFEIGIENLQCDRQKLESEISTITKQLDEVTKVKERYEKALEHIKLVLKDVQTPNNTLAIECFEEAKEALNGSSK